MGGGEFGAGLRSAYEDHIPATPRKSCVGCSVCFTLNETPVHWQIKRFCRSSGTSPSRRSTSCHTSTHQSTNGWDEHRKSAVRTWMQTSTSLENPTCGHPASHPSGTCTPRIEHSPW